MKKYLLIILCILLLTTGCKLFDSELHGVSIDKIREAKEIALQQNREAKVVSATGRRKNGEFMRDPGMTEVFEFVAWAYNPIGFTYYFWELVYEDNEWSVSSETFPPVVCDFSIDLEDVEIDVCDAWDEITEENYADSFHTWSLFKPLDSYGELPYFLFATNKGAFSVYPSTSKIESEPHKIE